ncbi:MAG: LysM peptidoglycan-binding domain-containing protein [Anaerolineaceae bacterium]|nr:LysM peptidoglycan-binding domain-containing protein [Anaerolineaceae bacterium]NTV35660.1 LysM peptidoglycan-binding domain-containing protein [Anaerolineaceae bacterium]
MKKIFVISAILILTLLFLALAAPVTANPLPQAVYNTPTAEPNGNIYYIVREGDSCDSITLLHQINSDQFLKLNNMIADDCRFLIPGKKMLIAIVAPSTATPNFTPLPTSLLPSPTPFRGTGKICIYLFEDLNGNGLVEDNEIAISGGAISIAGGPEPKSLSGTTSSEPTCFESLSEGEYNISVASPGGYNATTSNNYALKLRAGDQSTLDFGAQLSSKTSPGGEDPNNAGSTSPVLAIIGGLVLVAGVGLAVYARRFNKK